MGYLLLPLKAVLLLGFVSSSESFVDDTVYTSAKQRVLFNYPGIRKGIGV